MTVVGDVCQAVRSKNAGPFWVTIDLFFKGPNEFARYSRHHRLDADAIARIFAVDAVQVKHFFVESLALLKISFPRSGPQGGVEERDLHSGQKFVRLLKVDLDDDATL